MIRLQRLLRVRYRALLLGMLPAALTALLLIVYVIGAQLDNVKTSFEEMGRSIAQEAAARSLYGLFSGNVDALRSSLFPILEREDGFWLAPGPGALPVPTINGAAAVDDVRLSHGDLIEVAPAARYRFDTGEAPPPEPEEETDEPVFAEAPAPRRRRRHHGLSKAQRRRLRFVILAGMATIVVLGMLAAAVVLLLRAL